MELLANVLFKNDDLVVKNATLNQSKIAWWLSMPHTSGGKYLYDLFELCNATLTNTSEGFGWKSSSRPGGFSSIYLSGNTDYLSVDDSTKFQFGTSDFDPIINLKLLIIYFLYAFSSFLITLAYVFFVLEFRNLEY